MCFHSFSGLSGLKWFVCFNSASKSRETYLLFTHLIYQPRWYLKYKNKVTVVNLEIFPNSGWSKNKCLKPSLTCWYASDSPLISAQHLCIVATPLAYHLIIRASSNQSTIVYPSWEHLSFTISYTNSPAKAGRLALAIKIISNHSWDLTLHPGC